MKDKKRWRNYQKPEIKETLNALWDPRLDPETEKEYQWKNW